MSLLAFRIIESLIELLVVLVVGVERIVDFIPHLFAIVANETSGFQYFGFFALS